MLSHRCLYVCLSVCLSVMSYDVGVLWPNGCMDEDETCHASRPRLWPHCVRWGPSSPSSKGHCSQFSAHICCGQTAVWIKMALRGGPRSRPHCARWGPSSFSPKRGHIPPNFRPISIVAKRLDGSRCHLVWRSALTQATLCWMGTQLPLKGAQQPHAFRPMSMGATVAHLIYW